MSDDDAVELDEETKDEGWKSRRHNSERPSLVPLLLPLLSLFLFVILLGVPLGGLGVLFYGPAEDLFLAPVATRYELYGLILLGVVSGAALMAVVLALVPKMHWRENDPGIPRVTFMRGWQDKGEYLLGKQFRGGQVYRVDKDIATRHGSIVHVSPPVVEITAARSQGWDIELRTERARLDRESIRREEDDRRIQRRLERGIQSQDHGFAEAQQRQQED